MSNEAKQAIYAIIICAQMGACSILLSLQMDVKTDQVIEHCQGEKDDR